MTSEFKVNIKETKGISFSTVYKTLEAGNQSLKIVSDVLCDSSYASIRTTLAKVAESNAKYITSVKQMDSVLDLVVEQYEKIENDILGKKIEDVKFDWKLNNLAFDLVGNAGIVGSGIGALGKSTLEIYQGYMEGKNSKVYKGLLGYGKEFVTTLGELAENAFKKDPDWKEALFGNWKKGSALTEIAEKMAKYPNSNTFDALFENEVDGLLFSKAKNVGENMNVAAKWTGVAISAVTNGIDNYEEHGGWENSRFWEETFTETAVDFALGAAATAGVGAAAVALGFSAPAVAVGAIATGVVWAADGVTRWATQKLIKEEKGLTELISDTILDVHHAKIDVGKKIVSGIGNVVSSLGNNIGTNWRLAFG